MKTVRPRRPPRDRGTATAAVLVTGKNVKNGSLTGKDVKNNSLGSGKIKNGGLVAKDFKAGQLPAGAQGAQGAPGAGGAAGADGDDGNDGAAGPSDVYADGATGVALDTTATADTEVASVTVPTSTASWAYPATGIATIAHVTSSCLTRAIVISPPGLSTSA